MAVYRGPACRICRREGQKLMLKGDRCKSDKCAMERRAYPPGMRTMSRRRTRSEYDMQLREKQKMRRMYGLMEKQFRIYFAKAARRSGVTGENLLQLLETRLDNIVYRLGFAPSRNSARQLVLHNHFLVNNRKVTIPSFRVKTGDVIQVCEQSKNIDLIHTGLRGTKTLPEWLSIDKVAMSGTLLRVPERASIPVDLKEQLIVELYSK